jgi:phosphatidylserine/phosphatidylglycerophosphate/cardiolipin synthase-like enzyme
MDTMARRGIVCRKIGRQRGKTRPLMHNKFIVGFDRSNAPVWVITGSYNATAHSAVNLENAVLIEDKSVAQKYAQEFESMWLIARK